MARLKVPDSHLQSPIRPCLREFIFKPSSKIPPPIELLIDSCPVKKDHIHIDSEKTYALFLSQIYNEEINISNWASTTYNSAFTAANSVIRPELEHLGIGIDEYPPCLLKSHHLRWATSKVKWEDIRSRMQTLNEYEGWKKLKFPPDGSSEAYLCTTYLLIFCPEDDKWYALDYEQVMLITDTISSRFFTLLYMDLSLEGTPGLVAPQILCEIYSVFDKHQRLTGNQSFESISCWESIVFACILYHHDPLQEAKSYYTWRLESLNDEGKVAAQQMMELLISHKFTVEQLSELHGLYRHWGHPTVDEVTGCKNVHKIATNRPTPDRDTMTQMLGLFKRQFILSFIEKHGRWPRCHLPDNLSDSALHKAIAQEHKALNLHSPNYPLDDWSQIEFDQEFEFDYHLDYTDLIDDKSLAVERDDLRSIYCPEALGYKTQRPKTDRRCVR
jgi:hypothetical protein